MKLRELEKNDLPRLLELYTHLHANGIPKIDDDLESLWDEIITDKNHHIAGGFIGDALVSSCVIVIVRNMTHKQRPYAVIENVVTGGAYRNRGYASQVLNFARDIAKRENCYKIMLMTGSKEESTLRFYERAGYNRSDKTAFIQWL
ncbi:MAG: GNAT family N-acetyltransferase [Clostridiales bacterium]|nr:GNAT family N-acetyltransferase [Clostridiales bacterium]